MIAEERQNTKEMRARIEMEIQQSLKNYPERGLANFFNNFYLILPIGRRKFSDEIMDQILASELCSEKRKGQTLREFFAVVDKVAAELGIDADAIRIQQGILAGANPQESKFFELLRPIYVRLREVGYNHFDLTG
ncbi:MAG: hypothetical protein AAB390_03485 [Patescibacteria group bacterium]